MISNEELMAHVQEARQRPNCFTLAFIGTTNPNPRNPTPTAAANEAERQGLSNEDVQRARWIAMYVRRGLGKGPALLREFFESEQHHQGEGTMTTPVTPARKVSKTERVRAILDALEESANTQERAIARNETAQQFDPDCIEKVLGIPMRVGTKKLSSDRPVPVFILQFQAEKHPELYLYVEMDPFVPHGIKLDVSIRMDPGLLAVSDSFLVYSISMEMPVSPSSSSRLTMYYSHDLPTKENVEFSISRFLGEPLRFSVHAGFTNDSPSYEFHSDLRCNGLFTIA